MGIFRLGFLDRQWAGKHPAGPWEAGMLSRKRNEMEEMVKASLPLVSGGLALQTTVLLFIGCPAIRSPYPFSTCPFKELLACWGNQAPCRPV